ERLIQARPDLALHLIQTLIRRIMALTGSVQSLALMDVYGRVARLLVELAREQGGRRVVPRMSQQKIADRVGASRSMVNRCRTDLGEGGSISVGRDFIELHRELPRRWCRSCGWLRPCPACRRRDRPGERRRVRPPGWRRPREVRH